MKNNKGISLIALAIAIVIMIILASVALRAGTTDYDKAVEAKEDAERGQVSTAIGYRYGNYLVNKTTNPLIGDKIGFNSTLSDYTGENFIEDYKRELKEYLILFFMGEGRLNAPERLTNFEADMDEFLERNLDCMQYTRILRHADIINLELDNISLNSVFLVNYYTNSVVGPII